MIFIVGVSIDFELNKHILTASYKTHISFGHRLWLWVGVCQLFLYEWQPYYSMNWIQMDRSQTVIANAHLDAMRAVDFEIIASLSETIWRSHYSKIISNAQIDYMLASRYTPEKLRLYLNASDRWLMMLRIDSQYGSRAIGYCSYALTEVPGGMKLEQLYLLPELHGQGLGRLMLRHVEEQARTRGCGTLVLQTNKRNVVAINFYRKAGFTVREEAVFDIGGSFVMDDYVMAKEL
jgi:ribosomal protein S18 acetylase RimI-like enzyme